ncbi:competence protein CoiA family protein [Streptococcus sp. ZJ151]|uniref:competence protein CoiA n=1 Tax=Streptococcus jiangjianxini TaxID=3161189 RepID=UPI0032EBA619
MLIAKTVDGRLAKAFDNDLNETQYYCPACLGPVRFKKGAIKTWHFAHLSTQNCHFSFENESAEHLSLKAKIFTSLSQNHQVAIEKYFPEYQQIADVFVAPKLVLEIQCSPISNQKWKERTKAYQHQGLYPIWLFGEKLWLKKRLSPFQKAVLSYSDWLGFYFWELDNAKEELRLHYLIHEKLDGELVYLTKTCSFSDDIMTLLRFPFQKKKLVSLTCFGMTNPQHFIQKQLFYKNPKWLKKQELAYQRGDNLLMRETDFFFPQIKPPQINSQNYSEPERIERYFKQFECYYKNQRVKTSQTLYPPCFYDKMVEKQTRRTT